MSVLREWFGPSKEAVWQQLSEALGGQFIPKRGLRKPSMVRARHLHWTIVIDTIKPSKQPSYTRIRANYLNSDSFFFRIFRRSLAASFRQAARLGDGQDVIVGYPEFDDDFIIQGNDERKLQALFASPRLRQIISWQPEIYLQNIVDDSWVTDPWHEGQSELVFRTPGIVTDLQQLRDLYDLFAELLDQLCRIGSAYENDPGLAG
ncbi:MAG: DUF3137 domain-containing protein [Bacteroidia bacterium]|nr:DUF3137 domain-containing protein [Bacteroidia bacterium]